MKNKKEKIFVQKGFFDYYMKDMKMDEKSGFCQTMAFPFLNIIVSIILTICFPFQYLLWFFTNEKEYIERK